MDKISLEYFSKPDISLGDYVRERIPECECLIEILGFDYIDLYLFNDINNAHFNGREYMNDITDHLPINIRFLYRMFCKKICIDWEYNRIKNFLPDKKK